MRYNVLLLIICVQNRHHVTLWILQKALCSQQTVTASGLAAFLVFCDWFLWLL